MRTHFWERTRNGRHVNSKLLFSIVFTMAFLLSVHAVCFAASTQLQWNAVTDANLAGYHVYYQANSNTQPFTGAGATPVDVVGSTSTTISGLTTADVYYLAVTSYDTTGAESPYSNIVSVKIPPTVTAFALPATATSASVAVTTLSATDNVGVTGYMITSTATEPAATAAGWSSTPPASFTFSGTGTQTAYAWAKNAAGNVSTSLSATVSITSTPDTTPPTISLTSPANGCTVSGTVTISASASDNVGVTAVNFYENGTLLFATNTTPYSYSWNTTTVANGIYTLSAKASDAAGNVGTSSNVTVTVSNVLVPLSPSGTGISTTPAFTFNAVAGSTGYQIYLQNNTTSSGSASAVYTPSQAGCASGTGTCSITLPAPLVTTDSYSWVASALNAAGQGPWSAGLNFIVGTVTIPPALTIISPSGTGVSTTPPFTFNAVAGATGYQIYLQNNTTSSGSASAVYTPSQAGCASGTGTCSITLPAPLVTTDSYSWVASALNAAGQGPWSAGLNFIVGTVTIPPALTIISPSGTGVSTTPSFTFNAVAGATGYQIYLQNNTTSMGSESAVYTPSQAGCASGTGTCSITLPAPFVTTDSYSWVASALNAAGQGPWSAGLNFSVQ